MEKEALCSDSGRMAAIGLLMDVLSDQRKPENKRKQRKEVSGKEERFNIIHIPKGFKNNFEILRGTLPNNSRKFQVDGEACEFGTELSHTEREGEADLSGAFKSS